MSRTCSNRRRRPAKCSEGAAPGVSVAAWRGWEEGLIARMTLSSALLVTALALPASASPADLATIERECGAQLNLPPGGCACIGKRAASFTDGQQAFIAAALAKDRVAQSEIVQTLTVAQLTEAGMFMTKAPAQCAQGE